MNNEAIRGKTVLVTGHTGFKGSWLSLWLERLGAIVVGYSLEPPTEPSNFRVSGVADSLAAHYTADVRDTSRFLDVLRVHAPDVIFHLAAQPLVRESYRTPRETFDVNVMGTVSVLDAVRQWAHPCVVVVVTSDKCYENREHVWAYRELDRMGGHDPYSASKGCAELVISSFRRSFFPPQGVARHGVRLASVRAGNVIGGGDWAPGRIVVDLVHHLAVGQPVPVRNPKAIRPWQHVLEPLGGYLALALAMMASDDPCWCSGWNFGPLPGGEADVQTLVEKFIATWGSGRWVDLSNPVAPHEATTLRLALEKARTHLSWTPCWSLDETVRRTVAWHQRFSADPAQSMRSACLADIAAYESSSATNERSSL